jgi:hypothetical protein
MQQPLDLFISETSVSNKHGLGITLQRVLGEELGCIKRFIHFGPFAKAYPPIENVRRRCRFFYGPLDVEIIGPMMTGRFGGWCRDTPIEQWIHSQLAAYRTALMFPKKEQLKALICPQGLISILMLEALKKRRPVRYVTWIMDEHLLQYQSGKWAYPGRLAEIMRRHLCEADTVVAISPALAQFYEDEFGVHSEVLFGPGDPQNEPIYDLPRGERPLRIGYFGSIWQWQHDALAKFAQALRPGKEALHIYSLHAHLPKELRIPAVTLMKPVPKERITEAMREYDAVLIPIGFQESQRKFSEFNIATKMSESLACGTQTIVFGPPYAAMVQFLKDTGAACVLTDETMSRWPGVAEDLINPDYRRRLLDAAAELVRGCLTTYAMRAKWLRIKGKLYSHEGAESAAPYQENIPAYAAHSH